MPFSTSVVTKSGVTRRIYNVDFAVGRIAFNVQDDVMLVQALLRIFYYELLGFNGGFDPPPGETAVIKVDGFIGPITQRHIDHFQRQMIDNGFGTSRDGRVDPYRKPGQLSTIQHLVYALELLNQQCNNNCLSQGIDNYSNLPNRTDIPDLLRNALKTVKTTARQYQ